MKFLKRLLPKSVDASSASQNSGKSSSHSHASELIVTWSDIEALVNDLTYELLDRKLTIEHIVAVARGGLIPAAMLAHKLGVKSLSAIGASSYVNRIRTDLIFDLLPSEIVQLDKKTTLVVDDIVDTGETFRRMKNYIPYACYCTLVMKSSATAGHCIAGKVVPASQWVVFPWECD